MEIQKPMQPKRTFWQPLSLCLLLSVLPGCGSRGPKLLWQAPIASRNPPIVTNGTVYVKGFHAGHPGEAEKLFALEAETGKERWVSADAVKDVYGESGGYVFFLNVAEHLVQLDAHTGAKIHESSGSALVIKHWSLDGDRMFLINGSQEVVAVDNRRNKELWRKKLPFKPGDDTNLQLNGAKVVVSGNFRNSDHQFGMVWSLDAATGHEDWHFEAPPPHDYAPLEVLASGSYVFATNTSPLRLQTHVLDAHTGKALYPAIGIFDLSGCHGDTVYASGGAFDARTGKRIGDKAEWIAGSVVYKGVAWKHRITTVGAGEGFLLRTTYDGDIQGRRDWTNTPPNSSLEAFDTTTGKSLYQTKEYKYTNFSNPVEANGVLYHTSIAMMKEGKSGVWAYRLPAP